MPPKKYPKPPDSNQSRAWERIREGHLTVDQVKAAVAALGTPMERSIVRFLYIYGLRASEPGCIHLEELDMAAGKVTIRRLKGSKPGVYHLKPWLLEDLKAWLMVRPQSVYLFPHRLDPKFGIDRVTVYRIFSKAARKCGFPPNLHHPHVLKHSIATHMLERGDNIRHVQAWLGHARIESTMVYSELSATKDREGEEVVDSLDADLMR